jgi:hypothetical protein
MAARKASGRQTRESSVLHWGLLALLSACSTEVLPVRVDFALDEQSCATTDMGAILLNGDCGGTLEVHLADEETPGRLFGSQCIDLPGTTQHSARDLPGLIEPHFQVTAPDGAVVSLQVAAHSSPLARSCDDAPRRLVTDEPIVSGKSGAVRLAPNARIDVTLACPSQPRRCTLTPILDNNVSVSAGVREFFTQQPLDNTLELDVSFGYVLPAKPSTWDLVRELIYSETEELWDTPHRFVLATPLPGGCYGTRVNWTDDDTLMTTAFLACEGSLVGQNLSTQGYYVAPAVVDEVVKALGHQRVPPGGLVLGIVLDEGGAPVEGASVRADGLSALTVRYLSAEDPMRIQAGATSGNGLFVVDGWTSGDTCCVPFTAREAEREGRSAAPAGLIKGLVTLVPIRLEQVGP